MSGNSIGFGEEIKKFCQKMCSLSMLIWSTAVVTFFLHKIWFSSLTYVYISNEKKIVRNEAYARNEQMFQFLLCFQNNLKMTFFLLL